MKLKILPLIFLGIYFANSSQFYSKLPQSACEIVSEVHKKESWMKTIAIVKFEKNFDEKLIDELAKCLPKEITVVLMDGMTYDINHQALHNVHYVVLLLDELNEEKAKKLATFVFDLMKKPILDHNSKFLVITAKADERLRKQISQNLNRASILNFAIIFEASGEVFVDFNNNRDKPLLLNSKDIEKIYPNHLKDLKKHQHEILLASEDQRVRAENGQLISKFKYFLTAVEKIENSQMVFRLMQGSINKISNAYFDSYNKGRFQMTLNTMFIPGNIAPMLMTYEETGFCPLVPKPEKPSTTFRLYRPFDWQTWTGILISIICCMALWKFSGTSTSIWYIPFFFWTFFQGQRINFATDKKVLVIVLQILVFMLFILGNAYQGVITSFMIEPEQTGLFKSFDELLKSDQKIFVGQFENTILKDNVIYQDAVTKGNVFVLHDGHQTVDFSLMKKNNTAILLTCDVANDALTKDVTSEFYVINENLLSYYTQLQATYLNKYLKQWQLIMDWCFEAGLPQAWEKFVSEEKIFKKVDEDRSDILKLSHLEKVFHVLIIGYILGGLALLFEILWFKYSAKRNRQNDDQRIGRRMRLQRNRVEAFEMIDMTTNEPLTLEEIYDPITEQYNNPRILYDIPEECEDSDESDEEVMHEVIQTVAEISMPRDSPRNDFVIDLRKFFDEKDDEDFGSLEEVSINTASDQDENDLRCQMEDDVDLESEDITTLEVEGMNRKSEQVESNLLDKEEDFEERDELSIEEIDEETATKQIEALKENFDDLERFFDEKIEILEEEDIRPATEEIIIELREEKEVFGDL